MEVANKSCNLLLNLSPKEIAAERQFKQSILANLIDPVCPSLNYVTITSVNVLRTRP